MNTRSPHMHDPQSGNVLFYILIAVALLASLSFAVSESGRGSAKQIGKERARLLASEIIEYSSNISSAVPQLRLRGCSDTQISFENTVETGYTNGTDTICQIFHLSGGAVIYALPSEESFTTTTPEWLFSGNKLLADFGTTTQGDLVMYFSDIKDEVCTAINTLLDIDPAGDFPVDAGTHSFVKFTGTYDDDDAINDADSSILNAPSACVHLTTPDTKTFYRILIPR